MTLLPSSEKFLKKALQKECDLLRKAKKGLLEMNNWRPISLLNVDYKILATIFAKHLKLTSDSIIDEKQSGFMTNRNISNNIRLVLDILDHSKLVEDDSFIFFLRFLQSI